MVFKIVLMMIALISKSKNSFLYLIVIYSVPKIIEMG